MPKTKKLNIVVTFEGTDYVINDLGEGKSQRFELYNAAEKKTIKKSNNPYDFDDFMWKVWNKNSNLKDKKEENYE